ncbi:SMI1/KNR4 family protein [Bradyrhizobium cajani]|uniref:SMI1/KNR4 family protein n=1 Tax=Bradyrhizobium cajani TaxID=1928661 RepID=A0A844TFD5_9BRAD|nr:SMI1/KNR4 family protein [Bradyrhizobium cajani]MCP3370449.1 SMI1/KNR4 family protein [Bradyrhizobium cajani]MVT77728.1 SMI1/KNR4 family protein [Bradyrhizobium cajani]
MVRIYGDFDLTNFWYESDYASCEYVDGLPNQLAINAVQERLGYTLPAAYIELSCHQNGGQPRKTCIRSPSRTTWAEDHVAITGIYSIGSRKRCSLCGEFGSAFWVQEWGYPPIGIYFADCPSAGHDMICLDYRKCGPNGEPSVVHVDQEWDYRITFLAENFESFIRGLNSEAAFDN